MKKIQIHQNAIAQLCKKYNVEKLYVFGSILTEKFNENSDIDFTESKFIPPIRPFVISFVKSLNLFGPIMTKIELKVAKIRAITIKGMYLFI